MLNEAQRATQKAAEARLERHRRRVLSLRHEPLATLDHQDNSAVERNVSLPDDRSKPVNDAPVAKAEEKAAAEDSSLASSSSSDITSHHHRHHHNHQDSVRHLETITHANVQLLGLQVPRVCHFKKLPKIDCCEIYLL